MTQAELKTVLDSSGIPFAYRAWKNGHDLPFGVFYFERDNPFAADGIVYAKKTLYALELYTAEKDPDTEAALEKALTAAGIFYSKSDEIDNNFSPLSGIPEYTPFTPHTRFV